MPDRTPDQEAGGGRGEDGSESTATQNGSAHAEKVAPVQVEVEAASAQDGSSHGIVTGTVPKLETPPRSPVSQSSSSSPHQSRKRVTKAKAAKVYDHDGQLLRDGPYVAIFDYDPQANDELAFSEGSTIEVLAIQDDGWCTARTSEGATGLVPGNYIRKVKVKTKATSANGETAQACCSPALRVPIRRCDFRCASPPPAAYSPPPPTLLRPEPPKSGRS